MTAEHIALGMRLSERFGRWAMQRLAGEIAVKGLERIPGTGPVQGVSSSLGKQPQATRSALAWEARASSWGVGMVRRSWAVYNWLNIV